ncbi:hypothetical protein HMPREF0063_11246 [Aeromicrobium marinum DSM 15272]|uniref:Cytidine deaminase n=1 Tax=Aeromicrobium marinum DSM 15272 TaxID=585531 RepID=E2SB37_9ACTN|nr:cytidine deaminase [Aeromicrobium marinum]EFQ83583.1 hypothetical protein HMPREF0063_11246 [Aeromicrobium marinum DSM 15272]
MTPAPEDAKLVTLARAARARTSAHQGAAVRDRDGRTYAASTVSLPSWSVDALDLAVAMAISSGATGVEAGAVVGDPDRLVHLEVLRDFAGDDVVVHLADPTGQVVGVKRT